MTTTPQYVTESGPDALADKARDHLWMHFTRHSTYYEGHHVPIITKGEGAYIWDDQGNKYFDGLSGLFVVQAGHGRKELAQAAAKQAEELAFFPLWSYAHPSAILLAERLANLAPGDLNRVFFTSGGGEAVESAWKLAKQYFKLTGKPTKTKVISRAVAYHGTPQGALSITGIPDAKFRLNHLFPEASKFPIRISTALPRSTVGTRKHLVSGQLTESLKPLSLKAQIASQQFSLNPFKTQAVVSHLPPVTLSAFARSATNTTYSWLLTKQLQHLVALVTILR